MFSSYVMAYFFLTTEPAKASPLLHTGKTICAVVYQSPVQTRPFTMPPLDILSTKQYTYSYYPIVCQPVILFYLYLGHVILKSD